MAKEEKQTDAPPADPVELDPSPALDPDPVPFDMSAEMPLDAFPEAMRESLKGKSFSDFAGDHAKMRKVAQQLGEKNKGLESRILDLEKKKPAAEELTEEEIQDLIKDRAEKEMVSGPDYRDQLGSYFETGEISEEFLDVLSERGYKPTRRDTLKFLSFLKADREAKIENINLAADGAATGQDLWDWMESDDCTMSKEALIGLNDLAEEDDFTWVGTIVKKYQEWTEGGGAPVRRAGKGRFAGPTRRGRPQRAAAGEQDLSKSDFSDKWMALTNQFTTGQISRAQEQRAKRELKEQRDRTLGVT